MDAESWLRLSPHLERALTLEGAARAAFIESLRREAPTLAADLGALLDQRAALSQEGFLAPGKLTLPAAVMGPGQVVGAYTLQEPIGRGGMGNVWSAVRSDGRFEGQVAVKLLNASLVGRPAAERFQREGNILARLRHPHIAQLLDAGVSPLGQPYLVLERIDGLPIDQHCQEQDLALEARLRLFADVLSAVSHAHANLIVHRDIKPSNVLVSRAGEVKLLDFGIAKLVEAEADSQSTLTRDGGLVLTPEYAAPEQLTGGAITTGTDVYALGLLLHLLLTGRHPNGSSTQWPAQLIKAIVQDEPPRMSEAVSTPRLRRQLAGDLDTIVARALKKDPAQRYPSVPALAEDLRRFLAHEPIQARPDRLLYRLTKLVRRQRTAVALGGLAALVLAGGVAATWRESRRAAAHAAAAEGQRARADQAARQATRQRDFAIRQLWRAEAINELDRYLLLDAAPSSRPFTAGDLLRRAERVVDPDGDPQGGPTGAYRAELLINLGHLYRSQADFGKAAQILGRAYQLAGKLADPPLRAKAACALASSTALGADGARAEALIAEAQRLLPPGPEFAATRIFCHLCASDVARDRDDGRGSLAHVEEARRLLAEAGVPSPELELTVSLEHANSLRYAGHSREAAQAFEAVFTRLAALGRADTDRAVTVLNNWAVTLDGLGRPREAEALYRRALHTNSADGTFERAAPNTLTNLAKTQLALHQLAEAGSNAAKAERQARRMGHERVVASAQLLRARVYRQGGDQRRAAEMLDQSAARMKRMYPAGHLSHAAIANERALQAAARGDLRAALAGADRAVALTAASARGPGVARARYLRQRSAFALALGRLPQAEADATASLEEVARECGPDAVSSDRGQAELALGRARLALGRPAEARTAFQTAHTLLTATLGDDHPDTRAARRLAAGHQAADLSSLGPGSRSTD